MKKVILGLVAITALISCKKEDGTSSDDSNKNGISNNNSNNNGSKIMETLLLKKGLSLKKLPTKIKME